MAPPTVLRLGDCDRGAKPDATAFFRSKHEPSMQGRLRGETNDEWKDFREVDGTTVRELQSALRAAGFFPFGQIDGVFDYHTLSGARLFQEYVRNVEGVRDIGTPDGVVGPKTKAQLARWTAAAQRSEWSRFSAANPSPECRYWLRLLALYRDLNLSAPVNKVVELVNKATNRGDTTTAANWRADPTDLNLIGIRRKEWETTRERANDDLFVLLVNGVVFKFCGSTDPSRKMAEERAVLPFIVRGQHEYRFGWHKMSDTKAVYRAFRPRGAGVLICRDASGDDAFADADLVAGLTPNPTVNIHWSGLSTKTWSAGCQVIAGGWYVDHRGTLVDCREYAAVTYGDLGAKTRGAYNVLVDLLDVHAQAPAVRDGTTLRYTLIHEKDFDVPVNGSPLRAAALNGLGSPAEVASVGRAVAIPNLVTRLVRA